LRLAGFSRPERIVSLYPHELSGGMAQRACIALALARGSRFLLADEPTTGLDPTVQQGILRQVLALKKRNIGILFITHELRWCTAIADEVIVLKDGQVVDRFAGSSLEGCAPPGDDASPQGDRPDQRRPAVIRAAQTRQRSRSAGS
jgi:peptide/nickel transport system ATP-binding protein